MKKNKLPNLVIIAILTMITIIFWIGFNVYRVFTKEPKTIVPKEILNPLNPELDTQTLSQLEQRFYIDENQIESIEIEKKEDLSEEFEIGELEFEEEEEESSPSASPASGPSLEDEELSEEGSLE